MILEFIYFDAGGAELPPQTRHSSCNQNTGNTKAINRRRPVSFLQFKLNRQRRFSLLFSAVILFIFFSLKNEDVNAQSAPASFTIINQAPAKKEYSISGYGGIAEYPAKNNYNLKFGSKNADTAGMNRVITDFVADGYKYKPFIRPAMLPYDKVIFNRKSNKNEKDLGKFTGFFENNGNVISTHEDGNRVTVANNSTLYYLPEYINTMDGLINSYIVNRGTDNLFANTDGETVNNIERVDLILTSGVTASDAAKTGFLVMERGGNDPFRIAAITGLTADGKIASLGPLVKGAASAWGKSEINITSTVFQQRTKDADIKPNENVPLQSISGSYISFQSLGVSANTTIYGIAVFPGDVTGEMDLLGLTDVPASTSALSGQQGGMDIMSGGGFFVEQNTELVFSLTGNVYNDGNGLTDSLINGISISAADGSQLYAYLYGQDGKIKAKTIVNADGSYLFENKLLSNTNYTVAISAVSTSPGDTAPTTPALPDNWAITGDSYGDNNQSGKGIQNGVPDLTIPVKVLNANIPGVNFGIEQLPVPGSGEITLPNPGGTNSADVPAGTFTNTKSSSDADGTVKSIVIFYPLSDATSLTIGNTVYTSADFAKAFPAGATILTDGSGNPLTVIKIDPTGTDAATVVIPYVAVDNLDKQSLIKGSATINFTRVNQVPLTINDKNSTNKNTAVSGSVTNNDTPSGDGGNTWTLVSAPAKGIAAVNTNGTYTYTPNNNYSGIDSFTYRLCDIDNDCAGATVTIRINDIPAAANDIINTKINTPVSSSVATNDTLSADGGNIWTLITAPANGTVVFNNDGSYTYSPKASSSGTDVFTYRLCDADNDCATAKVTIKVNDAPAAADDVNTTTVNIPVSGSVAGNDKKSADGGNFWALVIAPANGTVVFNNDGSYTYSPKANFSGTDVFTYRLCDTDSDCAIAKVTIQITAPVSVCGCNSSPDNLIHNGSFENGITGWYVNSGNFYTGSQYTVCGTKSAYLQRTCGTAKIWQDATAITAGQTLTLSAWAGTHTAGINCSPTLSLRFYDKNGYQILVKSVTIDKNVDKPDYKLKEFTVIAVVPSGAVKVRAEGSIDCDWLKLDAVCLTVTGNPAKGSIGDMVWNDQNGNGIQDTNETGLSGVKVTLVNPDNTTVVATTNVNGVYSFTNLLPGTYSIIFTAPAGTTASPADMGSDSTADNDAVDGKVSGIVIGGQNKTDIDAGFFTKTCINTPVVHSRNYSFVSSSYKGRATSLWLKIEVDIKKGSLPNNGDYIFYSLGSISLKNIASTPLVNNTAVPNGKIIADNSVTDPVTTYDAANNSWLTRVPAGYYGNDIFISGAIINSSTGFDANCNKYSEIAGVFSSNKPNFTSNWSYGLSCYQPTFTYSKIAGPNQVLPISCRYGQWGTPIGLLNCLVYGGSDGTYYSCSGSLSDIFTACTVGTTKPLAARAAVAAASRSIEVKEFAVKVSPNPSVADFKISIESNLSEKVNVRITDLFGRDVQKVQSVKPNTAISIGNLRPGSYLVEAIQGTERKIVRLIKI